MYVKDIRGDYKILWNKQFAFSSTYSTNRTITKNIRCGLKTQFSGGTTQIQRGAMKLLLVSNINPSSANLPNIRFYSRIYFKDN